jgi:predicted TIM-barrel fold metal-dependent hydrolase
MDLIDTHQHLIYRDRLGYGWTVGILPLASGDFTLADYAR